MQQWSIRNQFKAARCMNASVYLCRRCGVTSPACGRSSWWVQVPCALGVSCCCCSTGCLSGAWRALAHPLRWKTRTRSCSEPRWETVKHLNWPSSCAITVTDDRNDKASVKMIILSSKLWMQDEFRRWFRARVHVILSPGKTPFESADLQLVAHLENSSIQEHPRKSGERQPVQVPQWQTGL